jgi:hypothetical protein
VTGLQITVIAKSDGPLTKQISLAPDGSVRSDGSLCVMASGTARRLPITDMNTLAAAIAELGSHEAFTLGALRADLPEQVEIVTKRHLDKLNGAARPDIIARTADYIVFQPGQPAVALLDFDAKGMPPQVAAKLDALGDFWSAIVLVCPDLAKVARVTRRSTSAGLFRNDTCANMPGSKGMHVFMVVKEGGDIPRFLKTLYERCWLSGLGWLTVGAGGQLLERSIVDRVVGSPERLVFEGPPILEPPLAQDAESRLPVAADGVMLDTIAACPPLSIVEGAARDEARAKEEVRLGPEVAKAKAAFIARQSRLLVERTGMDIGRARRVVERQCSGVLLPELVLPFDDPEFAGSTVADVMADPSRFEGATLADPLEGVDYGPCKARIMRREDGTPWIHSFAHGRTVYELRLDARAAEAALTKSSKEETAATFVSLVITADLDADDIERLRDIAATRSGVGKRALDAKLKRAHREQAERQAEEERTRRIGERQDPRPQLSAPAADAEWLPQMHALNEVLGRSRDPEPPMRDAEGFVVEVRVRRVPKLHLLTASESNECDNGDTRLPAPEQPLLTRLDDTTLAELIERHIEYVDAASGRPVHLPTPFVKHYLVRSDDALPVATGVATLPIVLPDGRLLSGQGLDHDRGILFRVPSDLGALLPEPADCTPEAVAEAMRFLTQEWLCDLAADYNGRCVVVACALTILERLLLRERPAFFVVAGQRGGGKTTTVNMISLAGLGHLATAAAWSSSEEERRKALFSYLREGVALLAWDNLPRGAEISCPSIEKALTAETYSDRILGESETGKAPAFTVQIFTGNNITPRGDLASRSLPLRLAVDRPDPENRSFAHPDPIAWTEVNRGRILQSLYTVLLGNPRLRDPNGDQPPTRFKRWWHLVGSAVEYAAAQHADQVRRLIAHPCPCCPPKSIRLRSNRPPERFSRPSAARQSHGTLRAWSMLP